MNNPRSYDVIIAGASVAGCTAALHYARAGLSVALLDKQSSIDDHKVICTHFLQPHAVPLLRELALYDPIMEAGGIHASMHLRTRWGQFTVPDFFSDRPGINIRRKLLDPLLRRHARDESGVDLLLDTKVTGLVREGGRVTGVSAVTGGTDEWTLRAPLTVAADGRQSPIARMADNPARITANERFSFYAYFRHLPRYRDNNLQVWLVNGGEGYVAAFPQNDDLTLVSCYVPEQHFEQWQGRVEEQYHRFVAALEDGPDLSLGERVGDIMGMRRMPSLRRQVSLRGLAFIGDAAAAIDPLSGIGCTWALQSSRLLSESTRAALQKGGSPGDLDDALADYRRRHKRLFGPQYFLLAKFSRAKPYHPVTRTLLAGVVKLFGHAGDGADKVAASNPGHSTR